MRRKVLFIIILASVVFGISLMVHQGITPAYAQQTNVTARQGMENGQPVGEVLVNNQVVFRIRTSAGGKSSYERAQIAAQRLGEVMTEPLKSKDITTGVANGQEAVMAKGKLIVTADEAQARLNKTTPMALANVWAMQLDKVVTGQTVAYVPITQKVVPIISIGSGTRVGGALVTGASSQVRRVVAVGQLEGTFASAVRVRVMIPVSSTNFVRNITRVPGTSVAGLVDIKL